MRAGRGSWIPRKLDTVLEYCARCWCGALDTFSQASRHHHVWRRSCAAAPIPVSVLWRGKALLDRSKHSVPVDWPRTSPRPAWLPYDIVEQSKFHIPNRCKFSGKMAHYNQKKFLSIGFKLRIFLFAPKNLC